MKKLKIFILSLAFISTCSAMEVTDHIDSYTYCTSDEVTLRCKGTQCQDYDWVKNKWVNVKFSDLSTDLQNIIKNHIKDKK